MATSAASRASAVCAMPSASANEFKDRVGELARLVNVLS